MVIRAGAKVDRDRVNMLQLTSGAARNYLNHLIAYEKLNARTVASRSRGVELETLRYLVRS